MEFMSQRTHRGSRRPRTRQAGATLTQTLVSGSLGAIIAQFKSKSAKRINKNKQTVNIDEINILRW